MDNRDNGRAYTFGNGKQMHETVGNGGGLGDAPTLIDDDAAKMTNIVQSSRRWGAEQMRFAIIQRLEKLGSFLGDELQTVLALVHSTPMPPPETPEVDEG